MHSRAQPANPLMLVAVNLTRRCNLACRHCYLDATTLARGAADELSAREAQSLLTEISDHSPGAMVVLTGGEPLLRADLEPIARHGADAGLAMVVGTNGTLLTPRRVASLRRAGVMGVGVSLDSLDPRQHDAFRGRVGAWRRTLSGIHACRDQGLSFQIHFSVTEANAGELEAVAAFAKDVGARVLNVFFVVCTGRGESASDLGAETYQQLIERLIALQEDSELIIRARCAPYFKRIAHQRNPDSMLNRFSGNEGDGCIAGSHYCRVTPEGKVTACPYIEDSVGDIRRNRFTEIWEQAPEFARLREPRLGGKCGCCEYRALCGGCRARAVAAGGDLLDADPWCEYQPAGGPAIRPVGERVHEGLSWSPEAERRIERVPAFLRRMVRRRVEAYVGELGEARVQPEHLAELYARRFGAAGRPR